ncbi:MAG: nucleotide excision repair endonuclease [Acidimicrobiia bacterium]
MTALTDAVVRAPHVPGVYFFLGPGRDLLYVGKAVDLRRRLGDHARDVSRTSDVRRRVLLDAVCTVRWETYDNAEAASRREVDLIVMLNPAFNAAHVEQNPHRYVVVTAGPVATSFDLTDIPTGPGCVYGTFPHLAKGATSSVAKRTKGGYSALLRLLWAHRGPERAAHFPTRISGRRRPAISTRPWRPSYDLCCMRSSQVTACVWWQRWRCARPTVRGRVGSVSNATRERHAISSRSVPMRFAGFVSATSSRADRCTPTSWPNCSKLNLPRPSARSRRVTQRRRARTSDGAPHASGSSETGCAGEPTGSGTDAAHGTHAG